MSHSRDTPQSEQDALRSLHRVNIGCGATPTPGWINFDNSWSVRLAGHRIAANLLGSIGLVAPENLQFIGAAAERGVQWADAVRGIPLPAGSARVVYSSHMLEHLDRQEVASFLGEARRILAPGGILRIAVPDLSLLASKYSDSRDADAFVANTFLAGAKPKTLLQRCRAVVVGARHHHWMYDGRSLSKLLEDHGFVDVRVMAAGTTTIAAHGELDLFERSDESVYAEGRKP